jgi:hypothetical protein
LKLLSEIYNSYEQNAVYTEEQLLELLDYWKEIWYQANPNNFEFILRNVRKNLLLPINGDFTPQKVEVTINREAK